jgi:hypothetical protein
MKPHEALSDIKNVIDLLLIDDLAINVNNISIHARGLQRIVTYDSGLDLDFAIHKDFTQISEYRRFVADSMYLVMLNDGALIQASYTYYRDKLLKHRLGFYPCPVNVSRRDLLTEDPLTIIDRVLIGGPSTMFLRSPLRFDYAQDDATVDHPAVHLTLNWAHCRIASSAPLSFGHFVRIVFRHFYPKEWKSTEWLHEIGVRRLNRSISEEQACEPHIELGYLSEKSFIKATAKRLRSGAADRQ